MTEPLDEVLLEHFTPRTVELANALKDNVQTFMREHDVDGELMAALLLGLIVGGAHQKDERRSAFIDRVGDMYDHVRLIKARMKERH